MGRAGVRSVVWYSGVLVAGLIGGFVGSFATGLLYVIISETLFYFLSLCFTALLAALCAVLAGDVLAGDGRRVRLWSVVGIGQVAAVLAAFGNIGIVLIFPSLPYHVGLGGQMNVSTVALVVVCAVAVWVLRRPSNVPSSSTRDLVSAVFLFGLAFFLLVLGVAVDGILNPIV